MWVSGADRRSYSRGLGVFTALSFFVILAPPALSESYHLVPGDRLLLSYTTLIDPISVSINIDGEIRVPAIGAITVAELNLEAAERRIAQVLQKSGQFVDPRVDLSVSDYAPVVVAGDVTQPGRFEFAAGLTVAAAVAMAGGLDKGLHSNRDSKFILADLAGRQRGYALNIAAHSAKIAHLEALLAGSGRKSNLVQTKPWSIFWEVEQRTLAAEQRHFERLTGQWDDENAALQKHGDVVQGRFKVQQKIVAEAEKGASTARALKQKGLQTAGQLAASELLLANARKDVLELQSLQVSNEAALAKSRLARERYISQRTERFLTALQSAQIGLAEAQENQRRVAEQIAVLERGLGSEAQMRFRILSLRTARQSMTPVTLTTKLLPGDTLVVSTVIGPEAVDG